MAERCYHGRNILALLLLALGGCSAVRPAQCRPLSPVERPPRPTEVSPHNTANIAASLQPPSVAADVNRLRQDLVRLEQSLQASLNRHHASLLEQLPARVPRTDLSPLLREQWKFGDTYRTQQAEIKQALAAVESRRPDRVVPAATAVAAPAAVAWVSDLLGVALPAAGVVTGAVGTGGIGALALPLIGLLLRRAKRRKTVAEPVPYAKPIMVTGSFGRDTFWEAFEWAEVELTRKYPGTVGTMETLRGLIDQYLSAKGVHERPAAM